MNRFHLPGITLVGNNVQQFSRQHTFAYAQYEGFVVDVEDPFFDKFRTEYQDPLRVGADVRNQQEIKQMEALAVVCLISNKLLLPLQDSARVLQHLAQQYPGAIISNAAPDDLETSAWEIKLNGAVVAHLGFVPMVSPGFFLKVPPVPEQKD